MKSINKVNPEDLLVNSQGKVFACNKCHQPILKWQEMIDVEITHRFQLGPLDLVGSLLLHRCCAEQMFGEFLTQQSFFLSREEV